MSDSHPRRRPLATRVDTNLVVGPWVTDDQPAWTAGDVEQHLDLVGASHGVVRHSTAIEYDAADGNARLLAEIADHPRLVPAFVLGPLGTGEHGSAEGLAKRLASDDVRAVWLYPQRHGWGLAGPESASLLDVLDAAGIPVFVDLAETLWAEIAAVAGRYPTLDLVVSGIGYRMFRQAVATLDAHPNVRVDTSYLAAGGGCELLVGRYGAARVIAGSGAPVRDPAAPWFLTDRAELTEDERDRVERANAVELLDINNATAWPRLSAEPESVVDAHAHLGRWPSTWVPRPEVDDFLDLMRLSGTTHAVFSHLEALFGDTRRGNAAAISLADRFPGQLSVHLVVNPHRPQDRAELGEQAQSRAVAGIKVHPDLHDCPIDDPRYRWVWEFAGEHGLAVLSHGFANTRHSDPLLFGPVAQAHPELTLLIGHSGATPEGFRRTIEVGRAHPNLLAETCGSWMTGWWLRRLVDALGPDRVVHGTDSSLIDPRYGVGRVLGARFSPEERALVLAGNARRVLRLRPEHTSTGGS